MGIQSVSIIGLGALGVLFGSQLSKTMPVNSLRIIADRLRITKYEREGVYSNGERCHFSYFAPEEKVVPADLLIFAVKYDGLAEAMVAARSHVGENTIIMSLLNGISSEEMIGRAFGQEKVLYTVAQGMDAVKVGNQLTYHHRGKLCFGDGEQGIISSKVREVAELFKKTGVPFEIDTDMKKRQWGKFMLNVGVNQTVAVYKGSYGCIQQEGEARDTMISAMREVIELSKHEGVTLTEEDLAYWLNVLAGLSPLGKPSMAQDIEAGRRSEVELFSGTVIRLCEKHKCPIPPTNTWLYESIKEIETQFV